MVPNLFGISLCGLPPAYFLSKTLTMTSALELFHQIAVYWCLFSTSHPWSTESWRHWTTYMSWRVMAEVLSLTSGNFHILRSTIYERMIKVRRLLPPLILHHWFAMTVYYVLGTVHHYVLNEKRLPRFSDLSVSADPAGILITSGIVPWTQSLLK